MLPSLTSTASKDREGDQTRAPACLFFFSSTFSVHRLSQTIPIIKLPLEMSVPCQRGMLGRPWKSIAATRNSVPSVLWDRNATTLPECGRIHIQTIFKTPQRNSFPSYGPQLASDHRGDSSTAAA